MNRKKLVIVISMFAILIMTGIGFLFTRLKNNQPQAHPRVLVSSLGYCNSDSIKPCIVSFSVDGDGNMLINIITPTWYYPAFYLTISNDSIKNTYECHKVTGFPTNLYCTGAQMYPGEAFQFNLIAIKEVRVLAEGKIAIIGLLLPDPEVEALATVPPATEAPATEAPLLLNILPPVTTVPGQTQPGPSYPNPSYP